MSLQERSNLILDFAKVLFANGQATDQTISATERLARGLGLRARIIPRWGELELETEDTDAKLSSQIVADPSGVDMDRVASTMRAVEDVEAGRLSADAAYPKRSPLSLKHLRRRPGYSHLLPQPAPWRCR